MHRLSILLGLVLATGGFTVMLGWLLEQPLLSAVWSRGGTAMVFNSALCLTLIGLALTSPGVVPKAARVVRLCSGLFVAALSTGVLAENLLGRDLGLDLAALHLWWPDANPHPGRMAPNTALALALAGFSLTLDPAGARSTLFRRGLAAAVVALGALGLVGYAVYLDLAYSWYQIPRMAASTGVGIMLLGVALLLEDSAAERPSEAATVRSDNAIYAFLGLAVTILFAIALVCYGSIMALVDRARWVEHTHEVRLTFEEMLLDYVELRSWVRALALEGGADQPLELGQRFDSIRAQLDALDALTADNAPQQRRVETLRPLIEEDLVRIMESLEIWRASPAAPPAEIVTRLSTERMNLSAVHELAESFRREEARLLEQRRTESELGARSTVAVIAIGNGMGLLLLLLAFGVLKGQRDQRIRAEQRAQKLNLELVQRAGELEAANQELASFSYSVSHDLRAPLRAIDGYALMLEEDCAAQLDDEGRRYLSVIRSNSQRMGALIDDLLAFSRLGRQAMTIADVDMDDLVAEVIEELRQSSSEPMAEIEVEALPKSFADRALLRQVWINLISNALKYSQGREQPVVRISGRREAAENIYSIRDNGVGFDMAYYDKLFGVFQRLHRNDQFPGTGLGLAIVQRVVSRHGGRVWAASEPNQGADFWFSLPHGARR